MNFFKPEDFWQNNGNGSVFYSWRDLAEAACAIANRILTERGVRVYGDANRDHYNGQTALGWTREADEEQDKHTALLIAIEPIVRDTAESLLKEFVNACDGNWYERFESLNTRARKLLSEGEA